jgi:hypothetical protein
MTILISSSKSFKPKRLWNVTIRTRSGDKKSFIRAIYIYYGIEKLKLIDMILKKSNPKTLESG